MSSFDDMAKLLVGRTIREVRKVDSLAGDFPVTALILDNGLEIHSHQDPEGNGPGWLDVFQGDDFRGGL